MRRFAACSMNPAAQHSLPASQPGTPFGRASLFAPFAATDKVILQRRIKRRRFRPSVSDEGENQGKRIEGVTNG
jgi:hypothetical protein